MAPSRAPAILLSALAACRAAPAPPLEQCHKPAASVAEPAPPPPPEAPSFGASGQLTLRWREAWNMHTPWGADHASLHSEVTLHVLEGGRVRVEDEGEGSRSEYVTAEGVNAKKTRWRSVWLGSWTEKAGTILLDLERSERSCTLTLTDRGVDAPEAPCPELGGEEKMTMDCQPTSIPVGADYGVADGAKSPTEAWLCARRPAPVRLPLPKLPPPLSHRPRITDATPSAWIFGKRGCIETSDSRFASGRAYRRCTRPDGGAW